MDINLSENVEETLNFASIIAEAMAEYKSWNTCNFSPNQSDMIPQMRIFLYLFPVKPNQKNVKPSNSGHNTQEKRPNGEEGDEDVTSSLSMCSQKLELK